MRSTTTQSSGPVQRPDTYNSVLAESYILAEALRNMREKVMAGDLAAGFATGAIRSATLIINTVTNYEPPEEAED